MGKKFSNKVAGANVSAQLLGDIGSSHKIFRKNNGSRMVFPDMVRIATGQNPIPHPIMVALLLSDLAYRRKDFDGRVYHTEAARGSPANKKEHLHQMSAALVIIPGVIPRADRSLWKRSTMREKIKLCSTKLVSFPDDTPVYPLHVIGAFDLTTAKAGITRLTHISAKGDTKEDAKGLILDIFGGEVYLFPIREYLKYCASDSRGAASAMTLFLRNKSESPIRRVIWNFMRTGVVKSKENGDVWVELLKRLITASMEPGSENEVITYYEARSKGCWYNEKVTSAVQRRREKKKRDMDAIEEQAMMTKDGKEEDIEEGEEEGDEEEVYDTDD